MNLLTQVLYLPHFHKISLTSWKETSVVSAGREGGALAGGGNGGAFGAVGLAVRKDIGTSACPQKSGDTGTSGDCTS